MSDDLSDPLDLPDMVSACLIIIADRPDGNVSIALRSLGTAPDRLTRAQKIAARLIALLKQSMAREAKFHDGKPGSMAHIDEVAGPLAPPRPPVQPQRRASRRMRRGQ